MADLDEDPLDLLEDDSDGGVIETIILLDEEKEEKPILERTGCLGLVALLALPSSLIYFGLSFL